MRLGPLIAIKGATHYEAQVWRLWLQWPRWSFLRAGCWPRIRLAPVDD